MSQDHFDLFFNLIEEERSSILVFRGFETDSPVQPLRSEETLS